MNSFKKTTCTLLALWTPIVFAYSEFTNSNGEVLSLPMQVETAILLSRDGTPRCRIGKKPSKYLTAENLGERYRQDSEIDFADLDALRECDESDESYASLFAVDSGTEEIVLGIVLPPNFGKILFMNAAVGAAIGCSAGLIIKTFFPPQNDNDNNGFNLWRTISELGLGAGILASNAALLWLTPLGSMGLISMLVQLDSSIFAAFGCD